MAKKINWNEVGPVGGTPLLSPAFVTSRAGELVFTSGCVGSDPKTDKMPEDLEQQVRNALENLQNVLKASGSSLEHVIKVLLFVADPSYAAVVNRVYQQYLPNAPARSCVVVSFPNPAIKVELECVAQVPARRRGWFCRL
ncbi:LAFE_0F04368g1_1 [Lachancea fermentati]|uniref:LAFE_0F04368g1_1 n=1 Tax=Lachancea fermentati TaxID=4955 RepID=A0A1G4MF19_LACFM|nr:LAFE_0F04368g1_1 [Lachancea fermentati]